MKSEKVLEIVLREMNAYGAGWRMNWSDFDGRSLRSQLNEISKFADKALASETDIDYNWGSEF